MIRLAMIMLAAGILVSAGGCDRKDAEEPTQYDAELDGLPGATQVAIDPGVAADQRALSRAVEAAAPPVVILESDAGEAGETDKTSSSSSKFLGKLGGLLGGSKSSSSDSDNSKQEAGDSEAD